MAREPTVRVMDMGSTLFLVDDGWRPPRRSWPWPPTELERRAEKAGINDEDYRQLLRDEIHRRRVASAGDDPETTPGPHQYRI